MVAKYGIPVELAKRHIRERTPYLGSALTPFILAVKKARQNGVVAADARAKILTTFS